MIDISSKTRIIIDSWCVDGIAELARYTCHQNKEILLIKNGIFKCIGPYKNAFEKVFDLDCSTRPWICPRIYNIDEEDKIITLPHFKFEYLEEGAGSTRYDKFINRAILACLKKDLDV